MPRPIHISDLLLPRQVPEPEVVEFPMVHGTVDNTASLTGSYDCVLCVWMFNLSGALVFLFGLSLRSSVASGVAGSLVDAGGGSEGKSEGGTGGASWVDSRSTSGDGSRGT